MYKFLVKRALRSKLCMSISSVLCDIFGHQGEALRVNMKLFLLYEQKFSSSRKY